MFHTPLDVRWVRGSKDKAILLESLVYETVDGIFINVPKGFETDFASIPRVFRIFFSKTGKYRDAAVIHDYLYGSQGFSLWNRKQVDQIFLQAMKDLGVGWTTRRTIHKAVRLGGGRYWRKCNVKRTKAEVKESGEGKASKSC